MAFSTWPCIAQKFGPSSIVAAVREQPDAVFHFIVRGAPAGLAAARATTVPISGGITEDLALVEGLLLPLKVSDAEALTTRKDIAQVYYVRKEIAPLYARAIKALGYAWVNAPSPGVVNMSFGPDNRYMPLPSDANDPMNLATGKVAGKGFAIVMAIGNYYEPDLPNPGVTNPWCKPAWIICVGAVNADATVLFEKSARSDPADPSTWPHVVAYGINVLSNWPAHLEKSPLQRAQDNVSPEWRALPDAQKPAYAVMSGSSQAAAQVSRSALQVIHFLRQTLNTMKGVKGGDVLFSIDIPRNQHDAVAKLGVRLTGDVHHVSAETVRITYRLDTWWKLVKQILIDTAQTLPDFPQATVGAGFVSPAFIDAQFGRFDVGIPSLMSLKIL